MSDFEKICDYIEKNRQKAIELETVLTAIPALAPESGGNGELAKCEALEKWLKENGINDLERFDAADDRVESKIRPNLIATIKGKDDTKSLWIMSHMDVVPAGEPALWHTDPFTVVEKDGKLYGRGVEDDQQGLVCSVMAALALNACGIVPQYTVKLLFVADEEVGSAYGIQHLLNNYVIFGKDDLIIIPDGGDEKGETIEIAEKNLLWGKFRTIGKQAHGSTPDSGINAHLAACDLALKLNALESDLTERDDLFDPPRSTFQPTKKEANVPNVNTIPGEDVFYMDCRILPCYSLDFIRSEIKKRVALVEEKYGVKIDFSEQQSVESPATPKTAEVVEVLGEALKRVLKIEPKLIGIGGGTVGAYLRKAGFNAVVWSLQDETMHQPDEYCVIQNLIDEAKVLASVMVKNC